MSNVCYLLFYIFNFIFKEQDMKKMVYWVVLAALALGAGFSACDTGIVDDVGGKIADSGGFVAVTGITGVPTGGVAGRPVNLNAARVSPVDATKQTIAWTLTDAGTTGAGAAEVATGIFTPQAAGTLRVRATVAGGDTNKGDYVWDFTIPVVGAGAFVAVTDITEVPATGKAGEALDLSKAVVTPSTATNKTIVWSKAAGNAVEATIDGASVTPLAAGPLTLTAKIAGGGAAGADYTKNFSIIVSAAGGGGTEPTRYTITFSAGEGGGTVPAAKTVNEGSVINLPGSDGMTGPSYDTFLAGWKADGGGTLYQAGVPYPVNADVTLTAEWRTLMTDIASVQAYLDAFGATTAATPIPLPVGLTLADSSNGWTALLTAIETADKFVDLYLSVCTIAGTAFDPGTATIGKSKIVSLFLPFEARSIKAGTTIAPTFRYFTALAGVSGGDIRSVGSYTFCNCASLTTVNFPYATGTGMSAFQGCTSLTSVSLPEAAGIGESAFQGCASLTAASLPKATDIGTSAFQGCTALTAASLPKAEYIRESAFQGCASLTAVSLPAATDIRESAFQDCASLATVSLPEAVTIGIYAFRDCASLTTADFPEATTIGDGAFYNCTELATASLPAATRIGGHAFSSCWALTSASLPAATRIGDYAFSNCRSLTAVSLPEAKTIAKGAFSACTYLASVSLPKAASIGDYVFSSTDTTALTVTLGTTVPRLGYRMFYTYSIADTRNVTVRVPSGAAAWTGLTGTYNETSSYTVNWGNGFRGAGWWIINDEGAFSTDPEYGGADNINSNIRLTIEYISE
jgi:hypothetical protein